MAQRRHFADRECVTCHFLKRPEQYREHLTRAPAP
jgi:hypothetical protein